jgi:hypothetical protein
MVWKCCPFKTLPNPPISLFSFLKVRWWKEEENRSEEIGIEKKEARHPFQPSFMSWSISRCSPNPVQTNFSLTSISTEAPFYFPKRFQQGRKEEKNRRKKKEARPSNLHRSDQPIYSIEPNSPGNIAASSCRHLPRTAAILPAPRRRCRDGTAPMRRPSPL